MFRFHKLNCDVNVQRNRTGCCCFCFLFFGGVGWGGGGWGARHENLYMGVHTKCLFT